APKTEAEGCRQLQAGVSLLQAPDRTVSCPTQNAPSRTTRRPAIFAARPAPTPRRPHPLTVRDSPSPRRRSPGDPGYERQQRVMLRPAESEEARALPDNVQTAPRC